MMVPIRTVPIRTVIATFAPNERRTIRQNVAARIDQLVAIRVRAADLGITLGAAEVTLIESIVDRLYRERARPDEVADSLAIRAADDYVIRFLDRLGAG